MVAGELFVVRIPQALYDDMVAHIVAGYPNEACGALGSKDGQVVKHYPTTNAAEQPDDFSIIAPETLLDIFDDIEEYDGEMIYYHSHPQSEAYPSRRDKDYAKLSKILYIIFSHRFYPEPPYSRVFLVHDDDSVTEGRIVIE
ncbi:MAG TPA: M67 family metallopeptidase [Ktedonobacteraceae bacterium]|nr:M67 family metallopeptidase [Ktedonobacteraceae bacterium]